MALVQDLILQTANAPGTATFNLISPPAGRISFVAGTGVGLGFYYAHDGTSFEKGIGTVTAGAPDTLSRDTVLRNSLGTTAKINFTSTTQIYCEIPSERAFWADENAVYQAQARRIANLAQGTSQTDAVRLDQVGWQAVTQASFSSAVSFTTFSLPSTFRRFRLEVQNMAPAVAGPVFVQCSFNGGVSYSSGATDYTVLYHGQDSSTGAIVVTSATNAIYLGPTASTSFPVFGSFEIDILERFSIWHLAGITSANNHFNVVGMGRCVAGGTITNLLIGFSSGNTSRATINLMGRT